jgi:pimeloyl-ACP methyl ester carboxylesterase
LRGRLDENQPLFRTSAYPFVMSEIFIPVDGRRVAARVEPAQHPRGTVLFVHGSGVDRHDSRNQFVARRLRREGFDTVALDLLEPHEALDCHHAFDIELQAKRLEQALERLRETQALHEPLGYFATGVGAGVVLLAAARSPEQVVAIVARSGRPDTALFCLPRVKAPTLLIVEEPDDCNRSALERLTVEKALEVVPSPSHFFREPEALEAVTQHALRWFSRHMPQG